MVERMCRRLHAGGGPGGGRRRARGARPRLRARGRRHGASGFITSGQPSRRSLCMIKSGAALHKRPRRRRHLQAPAARARRRRRRFGRRRRRSPEQARLRIAAASAASAAGSVAGRFRRNRNARTTRAAAARASPAPCAAMARTSPACWQRGMPAGGAGNATGSCPPLPHPKRRCRHRWHRPGTHGGRRRGRRAGSGPAMKEGATCRRRARHEQVRHSPPPS